MIRILMSWFMVQQVLLESWLWNTCRSKYGNDESISWAMAGRSQEKLIAVSEDAKRRIQDVPHLTVDSNDADSIEEWCNKQNAY